MTASRHEAKAGGAQLVGAPGHPAHPERGQHDAESVLSLDLGAGPNKSKEDLMASPRRPARPAGYWERVQRIVDAAPPLTDDQRARIRAAFHTPATREAA